MAPPTADRTHSYDTVLTVALDDARFADEVAAAAQYFADPTRMI
jgi:hypothetical protein